MKPLTDTEKKVYYFIQSKMPDWVSPTNIGISIGGRTLNNIQRNSAWASPICKRLVIRGIIQRNGTGQYATIRQDDICYGCPDFTFRCPKEPCKVQRDYLTVKTKYQPPLSTINELTPIPDNQPKLL